MCQEKTGSVDEAVVKAVGGFGGGVASSGGVCGILLGGVAMISSIYSRGSLAEKENPRIWGAGNKFLKKFEEMTAPYGSMNCRDIAGVDWKDREAVSEYYNNPESRRTICTELVGEAAFVLGELLEKEEARQRQQKQE